MSNISTTSGKKQYAILPVDAAKSQQHWAFNNTGPEQLHNVDLRPVYKSDLV